MEKFKIVSKRLFFPKHGEYLKFEIDDSHSHNNYGIFYFVTKSGEVSVLNLIEAPPEGVDSISNVFDTLIEKEYDFEFYQINGMRQDAWRYFSDKSKNGNIWHMYRMGGTPFKNNLTDEELYSIKLIEKEDLVVEAQPITFNKWLNLSENEKLDQMRKFLDNPVKGSDYIFKNNFQN